MMEVAEVVVLEVKGQMLLRLLLEVMPVLGLQIIIEMVFQEQLLESTYLLVVVEEQVLLGLLVWLLMVAEMEDEAVTEDWELWELPTLVVVVVEHTELVELHQQEVQES
jgi:hypothetical protein